MLASFEKTADHLFDAAYFGQKDSVCGEFHTGGRGGRDGGMGRWRGVDKELYGWRDDAWMDRWGIDGQIEEGRDERMGGWMIGDKGEEMDEGLGRWRGDGQGWWVRWMYGEDKGDG